MKVDIKLFRVGGMQFTLYFYVHVLCTLLCGFIETIGNLKCRNGYCYIIYTDKMKYDSVLTACPNGYRVLEIHSSQMQSDIVVVLAEYVFSEFSFFIGLTDVTDGDFKWESGTAVSYTNFNPTNSNTKGKKCVSLSSNESWEWFSIPCTGQRNYICYTEGNGTDIETTSSTATSTMADTTSTVTETTSTVVDTTSTEADTTSTVTETTSTVADTTSTVADTTSTMTDTTSTVADTTSTVTETTSTVPDTTSTVADTTSTVTDAASTVTETTSTVADTQSTVADTTSTVADTTSIVTETTSTVTDATSTVTDTTSTVTDTTSTMTDTTSTVADTTSDTTPIVADTTSTVTDTTSTVTHTTSDTTPIVAETTSVVSKTTSILPSVNTSITSSTHRRCSFKTITCRCGQRNNVSISEELQTLYSELRNISISAKQFQKNQKLFSRQDNRISSQTIGYLGSGILIALTIVILIFDLSKICIVKVAPVVPIK